MLRQFFPVRPAPENFGLALLAVVVGCSAPPSAASSRTRQGIIDGELSPKGIEDAVLLLRSSPADGPERLCGASLVAPNLVVTARHCVAYATEGRFRCTASGMLEEGDPGAGRLGQDLPPETLEFFTNEVPRTEPVAIGARVVSTLSDSACSNDLAFVVLDRPVELPILALRHGRPALEGEAVVAVGYGADESADQLLDIETQRRRRKTGLTIAAVGPDRTGELGKAPPRMVIVDGPSTCVGDSGGPLLDRDTYALLAVHSLIEGDCTSAETRSWFTHVPPLWTWVERAFDAASATPTLEPEPPSNPCDGGCAGESGSGGSPGGGTETAGEGGNTDGDGAGNGGVPSEPPTETPSHSERARRHGGCALGQSRVPSSPPFGAALLLTFALARRLRFRLSAARRAGRG